MKIQFIETIKGFIEKKKLKNMPDEVLEEKIDEKLEGKETGNIPLIVGAIDDEKTQIELVKKVVEAPDISTATKTEALNELPHKMKEELFKKSIKSKELLAQKDINTFLKILVTNKRLQPYDELYYRIDKAFSDKQLADILKTLKEKRSESYNEEKVLRIVAKQMDVNLRKYGSFLSSHAADVLENVELRDNNSDNGKRKFDILNEQDRNRLLDAMKQEKEEIEKKSELSLTVQERRNLGEENLERQIRQIVEFRKKRLKEINEQNMGKSRE